MAAPAAKKTPHFLWCQDMDRILIRFDTLSDVKIEDTKLDITKDTFSFQYKDYALKFSFRFPVNPSTVKYRATRILELVIEKETSNAYWPHLLPKLEKKKLKVTFFANSKKFVYFSIIVILALNIIIMNIIICCFGCCHSRRFKTSYKKQTLSQPPEGASATEGASE